MLNFLAIWRNERVAVRELSRLSNHQLADLGIARADIKVVAGAAAAMTRDQAVEVGTGLRRTGLVEVMAPSWASHNRRSLAA